MDDDAYRDVQFELAYEIAVRIHNSNRDVHICTSNPKISLDANLNSIAVEGSLSLDFFLTHRMSFAKAVLISIQRQLVRARVTLRQCFWRVIHWWRTA